MDEPKEKKELARAYMERRQAERRLCDRPPLYPIERIQKELEWNLDERRKENRRKN